VRRVTAARAAEQSGGREGQPLPRSEEGEERQEEVTAAAHEEEEMATTQTVPEPALAPFFIWEVGRAIGRRGSEPGVAPAVEPAAAKRPAA
jgi:hypothetical protein